MDALIDWARQQPAGPATGHEILERYLTILVEGSDVFRFLEQNQATLRSADAGKHRFEQFRPRLYALVDLITGPDPTTRARIRTTAAFFSISASLMLFRDQADTTPDELRKIILEIAGDLTRDLDAR
jgi:hypothetical protein